ncbi:hypothetical protein BJ166DRAFT_288329 [Pestalotiopsis sp. NC0098]|nr:hypothetical protein BJ166DRAFT_288329 [Pestalotiopsis sp. NC0098]
MYHQIVSQLDLSSYTFSWAFPPCALSRYPSVPWPCPTLVPEPWAWPGAALERTLRIVGLAETVNGDFTILYHGPLVGRRRFCRLQRQRSTLYTVFPLHLVGFFLSFAWLCRCTCVCAVHLVCAFCCPAVVASSILFWRRNGCSCSAAIRTCSRPQKRKRACMVEGKCLLRCTNTSLENVANVTYVSPASSAIRHPCYRRCRRCSPASILSRLEALLCSFQPLFPC